MKLDRFIFNYCGNKYNEAKKHITSDPEIMKNILDCDIIAEPFGGIFGFSRAIFETGNFKGKIYINDFDKDLIDALKKIKNNKINFDELIKKINSYSSDIEMTKNENNYFLKNICSFRNNLLNKNKGLNKIKNYIEKKEEYKDFFKKVKFYNLDFNLFFDKLKKEEEKGKKIFIFWDPPYFDSYNKDYGKFNNSNNDRKIYYDASGIYMDIFKYFKNENIKSLLIINKMEVLNYIFKEFFYKEYTGKYNFSKNAKFHQIFKNFP